MTAIFKREFKAYFNTPVGYIVLAAFYFFWDFISMFILRAALLLCPKL